LPQQTSPHPIILFDGVCNLCNGLVQRIISRDKKNVFKFGHLQSEKVRQMLKRFEPKTSGLTTIVLLEGETVTVESDALLKIVRKLGGAWSLLYLFIIVPKFIRDAVYRFVSRHRYRIFGRRDSCMVPSPEFLDKFI
jgi:predicted DCC family thiol-disulfide oxidoreductase YuxK